jgi:hypothetical protein
MGTPFSRDEIPDLIDSYVHFASPRFWGDDECIMGRVKYVDSSRNPKVVYVQPHGVGYSVRVDVTCYNVTEKIEEDEQHSSH